METSSDKSALRAHLRGQRRALALACPDAAERAAAALPIERLPLFASFSGYWPLGAEIDPRPLMARLTATGATAALPAATHRDAPLDFRAWTAGDPLEPDAFGIPSPTGAASPVTPQLVIAPVLGFDRRGNRLGQGAGHYDRTLANLRAGGAVFVLGLAYADQEVAALPAEAHDERLDAILTETGYMEVK